MKIIFAGTPYNSAYILRFLAQNGIEIAGVLTRTDARSGRKQTLSPSPVANVALELGIPLMKANSFSQEVRDWIESLGADVGVIVAYGAILRSSDLEIPRLGWLNLHFSLLPQLPGAAPVQHALMLGMEETGVTVFSLDEGVDTGPIISQSAVSIENSETAASLLEKLTHIGSELLVKIIRGGEERIKNSVPQPKGGSFSVAIKPTRTMAKLDFSKSAKILRNQVRGLNPEPMAWFECAETPVRVLEAGLGADSTELGLGEAHLSSGEIYVGCKDSTLILKTVQPAGKKAMPAVDWFRGLHNERVKLN